MPVPEGRLFELRSSADEPHAAPGRRPALSHGDPPARRQPQLDRRYPRLAAVSCPRAEAVACPEPVEGRTGPASLSVIPAKRESRFLIVNEKEGTARRAPTGRMLSYDFMLFRPD